MKNKKTLLVLLAVFVLLIGGASLLYGRLEETADTEQLSPALPSEETEQPVEETPGAGDPPADGEEDAPEAIPAPDFTVYDGDGIAVRLHEFFGKPTVVNFWASWCGPCRSEMPDFHEKYLQLGETVNFLMVNMTTGRETEESAAEFIAESGYTFPVFFDLDGDAASTYGAYSLPTTYFIDAMGNVVARAVGAIDAETLQRGIDMICTAE